MISFISCIHYLVILKHCKKFCNFKILQKIVMSTDSSGGGVNVLADASTSSFLCSLFSCIHYPTWDPLLLVSIILRGIFYCLYPLSYVRSLISCIHYPTWDTLLLVSIILHEIPYCLYPYSTLDPLLLVSIILRWISYCLYPLFYVGSLIACIHYSTWDPLLLVSIIRL